MIEILKNHFNLNAGRSPKIGTILPRLLAVGCLAVFLFPRAVFAVDFPNPLTNVSPHFGQTSSVDYLEFTNVSEVTNVFYLMVAKESSGDGGNQMAVLWKQPSSTICGWDGYTEFGCVTDHIEVGDDIAVWYDGLTLHAYRNGIEVFSSDQTITYTNNHYTEVYQNGSAVFFDNVLYTNEVSTPTPTPLPPSSTPTPQPPTPTPDSFQMLNNTLGQIFVGSTPTPTPSIVPDTPISVDKPFQHMLCSAPYAHENPVEGSSYGTMTNSDYAYSTDNSKLLIGATAKAVSDKVYSVTYKYKFNKELPLDINVDTVRFDYSMRGDKYIYGYNGYLFGKNALHKAVALEGSDFLYNKSWFKYYKSDTWVFPDPSQAEVDDFNKNGFTVNMLIQPDSGTAGLTNPVVCLYYWDNDPVDVIQKKQEINNSGLTENVADEPTLEQECGSPSAIVDLKYTMCSAKYYLQYQLIHLLIPTSEQLNEIKLKSDALLKAYETKSPVGYLITAFKVNLNEMKANPGGATFVFSLPIPYMPNQQFVFDLAPSDEIKPTIETFKGVMAVLIQVSVGLSIIKFLRNKILGEPYVAGEVAPLLLHGYREQKEQERMDIALQNQENYVFKGKYKK